MHPQSGYCAGLSVLFFLSQVFGVMVGASSSNREVRAYEEASQIYNTMFVEYDKRIRPQPNHTEPVLVRMEVTLDHIYKFDVTNQVLHSLLSLSLRWSDRRLAWFPQRLQNIYTQKARVWTPNLFLMNGLAQPEDLEQHTIYLEYQGNLVWHRKVSVQTFCPTDLNNETHTCSYLFASTPFRSSEEQLQLTRFSVAESFKNHFWNVSRQTKFSSTRSPSISESTPNNVPTAVGSIILTKDNEGFLFHHANKALRLSTSIWLMVLSFVAIVPTQY